MNRELLEKVGHALEGSSFLDAIDVLCVLLGIHLAIFNKGHGNIQAAIFATSERIALSYKHHRPLVTALFEEEQNHESQ